MPATSHATVYQIIAFSHIALALLLLFGDPGHHVHAAAEVIIGAAYTWLCRRHSGSVGHSE